MLIIINQHRTCTNSNSNQLAFSPKYVIVINCHSLQGINQRRTSKLVERNSQQTNDILWLNQLELQPQDVTYEYASGDISMVPTTLLKSISMTFPDQINAFR